MDKEKIIHEKQKVADMATEVLSRQAKTRTEQTGETFTVAFEAVAETEAGRKLVELRDGPHRKERAARWQEDLALEREKERKRARKEEERCRARLAAWERFMRTEAREIELRKTGQLAELLGEALPGEPAEALRRLASEDRRQAEEGLVALMSNGSIAYKRLVDLSESDMPARSAAIRLRTTWLKERHDGWLSRDMDH
ncbi:MAG: hypothetical protein H0V83_05100 [Rubrobacter sp.]|nr:hypothetical protein [Rubrobacter sp.]